MYIYKDLDLGEKWEGDLNYLDNSVPGDYHNPKFISSQCEGMNINEKRVIYSASGAGRYDAVGEIIRVG